MNYKRRKPKKKQTDIVDNVWGWKKSSKLDYRLKKEFKKKWKDRNLKGL